MQNLVTMTNLLHNLIMITDALVDLEICKAHYSNLMIMNYDNEPSDNNSLLVIMTHVAQTLLIMTQVAQTVVITTHDAQSLVIMTQDLQDLVIMIHCAPGPDDNDSLCSRT